MSWSRILFKTFHFYYISNTPIKLNIILLNTVLLENMVMCSKIKMSLQNVFNETEVDTKQYWLQRVDLNVVMKFISKSNEYFSYLSNSNQKVADCGNVVTELYLCTNITKNKSNGSITLLHLTF